MSLTHGMDPRVVRDIVQRLDAAAGELDQVGDRAHSIVHALQWEGADASRLTERWDTQGRVHIAHVADEVREAGKRLLGEVEAQDAASGSTGAGGGSGGLPGVADLGALVGSSSAGTATAARTMTTAASGAASATLPATPGTASPGRRTTPGTD